MDKATFVRLFDYHYWANRQLWRSVMALNDKQFTQALCDGSPSIQAQIVRLVANENLWINYLWHGEVEFLEESQLPTRASIRVEWDALEEELCDFIDELTPAGLARLVNPPFLSTGLSLRVSEILLQIINYGIDCRAQLRLSLKRLGSPAPAQDYLDFLAGREMPGESLALPAALQPY